MRWLNNGDRNIKLFHSYVRGIKRKLHVTEQGTLINQEELIGNEVVTFYSRQFQAEEHTGKYAMINYLPRLIIEEKMRKWLNC